MESSEHQTLEQHVADLVEFGFPAYEARLALKISRNDKEQAVELLTSGGADRETLEVLAQTAKINKEEPNPADLSTMNFNFINDIPSIMGGGFDMQAQETKMVIVVRADGAYANMPTGQSAKLVSEAVMRAYQCGQEFDPILVRQWEMNAWPKICVKCKSQEELLQVVENAKKNGINYYLLSKYESEVLPSPKIEQTSNTEEESKN